MSHLGVKDSLKVIFYQLAKTFFFS